MFEALSEKFDGIFARLRSRGRLSDAMIAEALGEVRDALIEADVNFGVARAIVARVAEKCREAELSKSLSPAQQVVKAVNEELVQVLGGETLRIRYAATPPTVVLLAGLQGSGKTTAAAKLARWFKQQGRNPLLVGADLQRPAAVEQLRVLASEVGVGVFSEPHDPVATAENGVREARRLGRDVLVVDTAGRLTVDAALMDEISRMASVLNPAYTFLVVDAMTGQDAVTTAEAFHAAVRLDGVILTKLDGDARGGAALSVKEVVGCPIAFASTGERIADFDAFHPDRMAGRILGMGDILSLVEAAEREIDRDVAESTVAKLRRGHFDLDDFLQQMQQIKKMGPLSGIIGLLPGVPKELKDAKVDEGDLARVEAIIRSMTPAERRNPAIIDGSRRLRIASGSGNAPGDVSNLLKQFKEAQQMMQKQLGVVGKPPARGPKAKKRKGGRVTPRGSSGVQKPSAGGPWQLDDPGTFGNLGDAQSLGELTRLGKAGKLPVAWPKRGW